MNRFRFHLVASLLLLFSTSAFADELPTKIKSTFQQMYPKATNVEWTETESYYIAELIQDNEEVDVWFDNNKQWVMTETDVESLAKIPAPVAEAFMNSGMAAMRLTDVRIITFPKQHPTMVVIEVEGYNSDEEFQLIYDTEGKLMKNLNVSQLGGEIYPGLFE